MNRTAVLNVVGLTESLLGERTPRITAFRKRGAQSRPTIMHGLDLITSVPFVRADRVRAEPYETTMQPGMTYNIEITPVDAEGIYGIFYSRSFAITETGAQDLTPYPVEEILVAG